MPSFTLSYLHLQTVLDSQIFANQSPQQHNASFCHSAQLLPLQGRLQTRPDSASGSVELFPEDKTACYEKHIQKRQRIGINAFL